MHNHDDSEDFFSQMGDVKPLPQDKVNMHSADRALHAKQKLALDLKDKTAHLTPLSFDNVVPVQPDDFLSYKQPGIQEGVFKNLRLGKYAIDDKIVISGLSLKESASLLYQAIKKGHTKGYRALLIQHGRGEQSKPFPALKKSYVQHWLNQIEEVIAYHTAIPMHGGLGATYVLLKKHAEQKQINRELNRRR